MSAHRVIEDIQTRSASGDGVALFTSGGKASFFGGTPVVKPTALTAQSTTLTHTAPGTPDFAIAALTQTTPFGFAAGDEGHTVLLVIANLQTRLSELETKLRALNLLT